MADEEDLIEGEHVERKKERVQRREQVKNTDAPAALQRSIIDIANVALDEKPESKQKDWAEHVKNALDREKGGTWHVIAGNHFGGNVTNDTGTLVNFKLNDTWFLVFRSGPPEKAGHDS
jgi:hypothetical protein